MRQVADSPTGRIFFSSTFWAIKAVRNMIFCECWCPPSPPAGAAHAPLAAGGDQSSSGDTSIHIAGAQRISDALAAEHAPSVRSGPFAPARAAAGKGRPSASGAGTSPPLVATNVAPASMAPPPPPPPPQRIDLSYYSDDMMLANDPVFAGAGPARRPVDASLSAMLTSIGSGAAGGNR